MQELRCARCGREGPEAHAFGAAWARAAAAVDDSLPNLLAEAWLGVDICPQCQTEPEKVLAAERIAAATLAAITSLADRGVDPHSEENPVITFAMRIQEALLGRIPPGHDHRERDDERDDENVEDGTKADDQAPPTSAKTFDVAITGAFLTGCALQVDIDNYEAVQRDLTSALTGQQEGAGWSSACAEVATGTYASGGGFTTNVPLVLVCRTGEETLEYTRTILDDQAKRAHDWQQERIPGWILDPTGIRIEVYDVGVGVIDGTFNVTAPTSTQTGEFAAGIKEIVELHVDEKGRDRSALAGAFRRLCLETATHFRSAVDRCATTSKLSPWLPPNTADVTTTRWRRWAVLGLRSSATPTDPSSTEWGRLLWLHPVHLLAAGSDKARRKEARRVAPVVSRTMRVQGGLFVPGIGWSAIVTADGRPDTAVLKLVHLHWAYYALHMEIDRGLLGVLNRIDTTGATRVRQRTLENEATEAFDWYARVTQARSRVDSTLAGLGGDEQAIWDEMSEVQKYDTLVDGVDRKVDALRNITDRRAQEASSAQARRATRSLGLLTALGLVSLVIASFVYFFGAMTPSNDKDRYLPYAVGFFVAIVLWWWINFSKLRRRPGNRNAGPLTARRAGSSARRPAGSRTTRSAPAAPLSPPGPGQ